MIRNVIEQVTHCFDKFIAAFPLGLFSKVLLPVSPNHVNEFQIISMYKPWRVNVELTSHPTLILRIYYKNRERRAGNLGNETENWNEVTNRATVQVWICYHFSFPRSPFPVPRSPFPVPRSPFPIPRSPFPVPRSPYLVPRFLFPNCLR